MKFALVVGVSGFATALETNDVVQGIASVLPVNRDCETNVTISNDVEHFLSSMQDEHLEVQEVPEIVAQLVERVKSFFHICDQGNSTLEMANGNIAHDFYQYIKNNMLKFDEQMLEEMEEMMKVCSFRAPDGKRCGQLLGKIISHIIFGDHAPPMALSSEVERRSFTGGVLKGLLGNSKNFQDCAEDVAAIGHAGKAMIKDLLKRDVQAVISDLAQLLQLLAAAISGRRNLDASLPSLPHPSLPAWVPHRSHECTTVEESSGQRQIMVPDCMGTGCKANGVDRDCAWCVYDLQKCMSAYGETCHETVSARESQNAACLSPDNETDTTTLGPDGPDSTTTRSPDGPTPSPSPSPDGPSPRPRPSPSPSPSPSPTPSPTPKPHPSPKPLPPIHGGACRAAIGDLRPFLGIFKDGPMGVYKNVKANLLEADEAMINEMEDMGKYCTFRHANAGKCGESLGTISRLIFVGLEESAIMV